MHACTIFYVIIDSKASEKHFSALILNCELKKDITKLSPIYQASLLEAFHSVTIHFEPKSTAISYQGMQCR